jgi:divalent metal cation (Fe/Co/Zn/Cd) transporter
VHIGPDEIVMTMNVEHHPDLPASEVAARTAELTERIRREHPDVFRVDLQPPPPR